MPAIDVVQSTDSLLIGDIPERSVCIDTEPYIEPSSPKTTESSSKYTLLYVIQRKNISFFFLRIIFEIFEMCFFFLHKIQPLIDWK